MCGWLEQHGLPRARQRVETTLGNLARARTSANNHQNAVAQNWDQGMFDVKEKRCYDCHNIIGVTGGGYCYDCARRHGWVY